MAFFAGLLLRTMSIRDKNPLVQKTFFMSKNFADKTPGALSYPLFSSPLFWLWFEYSLRRSSFFHLTSCFRFQNYLILLKYIRIHDITSIGLLENYCSDLIFSFKIVKKLSRCITWLLHHLFNDSNCISL